MIRHEFINLDLQGQNPNEIDMIELTIVVYGKTMKKSVYIKLKKDMQIIDFD